MDHLLCFLIYIIAALARLSKPLSLLHPGSYDEWRPGKPLKILLVGYNGARNTGSDVRTISIARQLKQLFGPEQIRDRVFVNRKKLAGMGNFLKRYLLRARQE